MPFARASASNGVNAATPMGVNRLRKKAWICYEVLDNVFRG